MYVCTESTNLAVAVVVVVHYSTIEHETQTLALRVALCRRQKKKQPSLLVAVVDSSWSSWFERVESAVLFVGRPGDRSPGTKIPVVTHLEANN